MNGGSRTIRVRIYYEDTDHGGVVYYANYLKFMERGRTEYLRASGIQLDDVEKEHGILFAVTEAAIRYRAPARFNDLLEVESRISEARGARLTFCQTIWRLDRAREQRDILLTEGTINLACTDRDGRARRIPDMLFAVLNDGTEALK